MSRINRRDFLRLAAVVGSTASALPIVTACSSGRSGGVHKAWSTHPQLGALPRQQRTAAPPAQPPGGLYVVGGWTDYLTEGQLGNASNQQIEDPNALDVHSFDEWGDNSVLPDTTGAYWWHLMALGKTNAVTLGQAIWYRSFFIFTHDGTKPNAREIIGGTQLFWRGDQTAEDYAWGDPAEVSAAMRWDDWVGIGVSAPGVWRETEDLDWEDYDFPEGGGDPSQDVPSGAVPGGAQLFSVAEHAPWGWSLAQVRLFLKPPDANGTIGVVGWKERVKDRAEKHDWVVTDNWGRSSTERSHTMGVGQWRTAQWGWGPSLLTLHLAPKR